MEKIGTIGLYIANKVAQAHGIDSTLKQLKQGTTHDEIMLKDCSAKFLSIDDASKTDGIRKSKKEETLMLRIASIAAMSALGLVSVVATSSTAKAAGCYYQLYHDDIGVVTGPLGIQGYATAVKLENACDRARRECNRRFERARKKGNVPRGGPRDMRCIRTSTG